MIPIAVLTFLFWVSVIAIGHCYVVYPLLLRILSKIRPPALAWKEDSSQLSNVSILIAAYNEETVIESKLQNCIDARFPKHQMQILVGSDCSNDGTDAIVQNAINTHGDIDIELIRFDTRCGKGSVISELAKIAKFETLILTDAESMLAPDAISELVKPLQNPQIGLVGATLRHKMVESGSDQLERFYISREMKIKQYEGHVFGTMIGPFGSCFALRRSLFSPVPKNLLVDDLYINMKVLQQGYRCVAAEKAVVFEKLTHGHTDEFRRKIRIASGSFQNLFAFWPLIFRLDAISFCFVSHKVLRWLGPIFLITAGICGAFLSTLAEPSMRRFYAVFLAAFSISLLCPLADKILAIFKLKLFPIRLISYFYLANLAIVVGFIRFARGIDSGAWVPTLHSND